MTGIHYLGIDNQIARSIIAARSSIDVAAQSLIWPSKRVSDSWPRALAALALAPHAGVRVRLLLASPRKSAPATLHNRRSADRMIDYGGEARLYAEPRLLHAKLIIIDNRIVWCGSVNLTRAALMDNAEAAACIDDPYAARVSVAWFDAIWRSGVPVG